MLPETGFLRLSEVLELIPVGKTLWWQWVKEGKAPQGVKLSPRTTAWRAEDIRAFMTCPYPNDCEVWGECTLKHCGRCIVRRSEDGNED